MSASDSHHAEVRESIHNVLAGMWLSVDGQHEDTDADKRWYYYYENRFMILLDSERERWIGEVKAALPAKRTDSYIKHDYNTGKDIKTTKPKTVGFNEALDAVSRVLDEL